MHLLCEIIDLGQNLDVVGHAVVADKIDAERNLICSKDLLTRDIHLCQTGINKAHVYFNGSFPEVVSACIQNALKLLTKIESCLLIFSNLNLGVVNLRNL